MMGRIDPNIRLHQQPSRMNWQSPDNTRFAVLRGCGASDHQTEAVWSLSADAVSNLCDTRYS
jgi:hypothetical protein